MCRGTRGDLIWLLGKTAAGLTGAGYRRRELRESWMPASWVIISAAVVGMIGAFASQILSGQILSDGSLVLSGPESLWGHFWRHT